MSGWDNFGQYDYQDQSSIQQNYDNYDEENESVEEQYEEIFLAAGSPLKIDNKKKKKGHEKLKFLPQLIWLSSQHDEDIQKMRMKIYLDNL